MSSSEKLVNWSKDYFHYDQHDGTFTIETKEDIEPLIKVAHNMSSLQPSKEWRHSAVIPKFVLDDSLRKGWFKDNKKWKKWANDHQNKPFRTWPGRL
jgi:hypothetical protein